MARIATRIVDDRTRFAIIEKVEQLNRRAAKLGLNPITVEVTKLDPIIDDIGDEIPQFSILVEGDIPCVKGWALAAVVERDEIIGSVVKVLPGPYADEDYSDYRDNLSCDHCGTRRYRSSVYVLRRGDESKLVGRNCLADFCRAGDVEGLVDFLAFCSELQDCSEPSEFSYGADSSPVNLERFLALVRACTRVFGWVSRTEAGENMTMSTADRVLALLYDHSPTIKKMREKVQVTDLDRRAATAASTWAAELEDPRNEYLHTINAIAKAGETNRKLAGYAASTIRAHERHLDQIEKRKNAPATVFLGEPCRTKDLGVVTVKRVRYIDGLYGTKTIVAMEQRVSDTEVAPITWFATGSLEFEEGEALHLRGAIKECKEDEKWGKQTIVTRCKLTEVS